jgi:hypothetical protein
MSDQKPIDESGAEATTQAAADAKTIDAESSSDAGKARIFPLALHKPSPQTRRFALLAASLALAAGLGGLIGSLSTYGLAAPKPDPEPAHNLQAALTKVTKDIGALKASIDAANRAATAQVAKLNERFDRSERAQAEPTAKIAALTDTVAKLEKRIVANAETSRSDVTGSIPQRAAAAPAKDASKLPIVEGWVLREIYRGRALLENRDTLYEVVPGADLPGVGKVQTITRQDGRWVVVTPKGLIVSMR